MAPVTSPTSTQAGSRSTGGIVMLGQLPNDCSGGQLSKDQPHTPVVSAYVEEWYSRKGVRDEGLGIVRVHADGDDPLMGPHLPGSPRASEERIQREQWLMAVHANAKRGLGLGSLADLPGAHPAGKYFRTLPPELLRQNDVMQCLRGGSYTTRLQHQVETGFAAGQIALRAGLSRYYLEAAYLTSLNHDIGHFAFAHSSEEAIQNFLVRHGAATGPHPYNHATQSAAMLSGMRMWDPVAKRTLVAANDPAMSEIVHGAGNHSWHMSHHGDGDIGAAGMIAGDLAGAGDRLKYSISDLGDAIRSGRIEWREVPSLLPQALDAARMPRSRYAQLLKAGPVLGLVLLEQALSETFIDAFADTIRNTGRVGLPFEYSDALMELRTAASDRLFMQADHDLWEKALRDLCDAVLEDLATTRIAELGEQAAAVQAVRDFGTMTESQVLTYARRQGLVAMRDVQRFAKPPTLAIQRNTRPAPRPKVQHAHRLKSLNELLDLKIKVRTDDGKFIGLNAQDAMNLLGLLTSHSQAKLFMKFRNRDGQPSFTLPTDARAKRILGQRVEDALEKALSASLDRAEAIKADGVKSPADLADRHSLFALLHLNEVNEGRPAPTLREYSDNFHRGHQLGAPELSLVAN